MIPINLELLGFPISQSDSANQRDMYPAFPDTSTCYVDISYYYLASLLFFPTPESDNLIIRRGPFVLRF